MSIPQLPPISAGALRATRFRRLRAVCRWIPVAVTEEFLDTMAEGDEALESAYVRFALERVDEPVREALRYGIATRSLQRATAAVFAINLWKLHQGELISAAPRWWLLLAGIRPIPLWRVKFYGGG